MVSSDTGDGVIPVEAPEELDTYQTSSGLDRIATKQPPKAVPILLDDMLDLANANLNRLNKPDLIRMLATIQAKIQEYKDQVCQHSAIQFSEKLSEVKTGLQKMVSAVMGHYPITYSENPTSKRTRSVAFAVLTALAYGNTRTGAAHLAGMGYAFLSDWIKDDPDGFGEAVQAARSLFQTVVNDSVLRLLVGGELKRIRTRYDRDGEGYTETMDYTTPDPRIAIAAKTDFKKKIEHSGVVEHRVIPPERERKLKELGDEFVRREIGADYEVEESDP